jgi:hypothetical protein
MTIPYSNVQRGKNKLNRIRSTLKEGQLGDRE